MGIMGSEGSPGVCTHVCMCACCCFMKKRTRVTCFLFYWEAAEQRLHTKSDFACWPLGLCCCCWPFARVAIGCFRASLEDALEVATISDHLGVCLEGFLFSFLEEKPNKTEAKRRKRMTRYAFRAFAAWDGK